MKILVILLLLGPWTCYGSEPYQDTLISQINVARANAGLYPLVGEALLNPFAAKHSATMARTLNGANVNRNSHSGFVGAPPWANGEIIAGPCSDPLTQWRQSSPHWSHIVSKSHHWIGVGSVNGYWTCVFAD